MGTVYVGLLFVTVVFVEWKKASGSSGRSWLRSFTSSRILWPARIFFRLKLNRQMPTGVQNGRQIPFQCLTVAENRIEKILSNISIRTSGHSQTVGSLLVPHSFTILLTKTKTKSTCVRLFRGFRVTNSWKFQDYVEMRESTYSHHSDYIFLLCRNLKRAPNTKHVFLQHPKNHQKINSIKGLSDGRLELQKCEFHEPSIF